jgi:hypothetical protein
MNTGNWGCDDDDDDDDDENMAVAKYVKSFGRTDQEKRESGREPTREILAHILI